jgi:hypothetical protein
MLLQKLQKLTKDCLALCEKEAEQFIDKQQMKIDKLKTESNAGSKRADVNEKEEQNKEEEKQNDIKELENCNKTLMRTLTEAIYEEKSLKEEKTKIKKGTLDFAEKIENEIKEMNIKNVIQAINIAIEYQEEIIKKMKGK